MSFSAGGSPSISRSRGIAFRTTLFQELLDALGDLRHQHMLTPLRHRVTSAGKTTGQSVISMPVKCQCPLIASL